MSESESQKNSADPAGDGVDWEQLVELVAPSEVLDPLGAAGAELRALTAERLVPSRHGDLTAWARRVQSLPAASAPGEAWPDFDRDVPRLGAAASEARKATLRAHLEALRPWRKGPFDVGGVEIDAEWRCQVKWARLSPHLSLTGKRVLDVGSGNGYFCLRALGAGASLALGVDPSIHYVMQFAALRRFAPQAPAAVLPLTLEQVPEQLRGFHLALSMGVLYHRRSPLDHLQRLKSLVRPGGQVVVETLVAPGAAGYSLMPKDRYAGMRNVWFIPSTGTLLLWLERLGYENCRVLDESPTTKLEQRLTAWGTEVSLEHFLSPDGATTVEGYPPPVRVMCIADVPAKKR